MNNEIFSEPYRKFIINKEKSRSGKRVSLSHIQNYRRRISRYLVGHRCIKFENNDTAIYRYIYHYCIFVCLQKTNSNSLSPYLKYITGG